MIARAFITDDRKLQPFWRAVIFFVLGNYVLGLIWASTLPPVMKALRIPTDLSPGAIAFAEFITFLTALICTAVMAAYEKRRIDSYGLPIDRAFSRNTWEGMATGVVMAGAVALGMLAFGGMQIHGLATTGPALMWAAVAWLVANVCVGVAEEFWYRSYFLQTLWKAFGFWPGAIIVALIFAADHYFFKTGENVWDVITLVSLSLLMSYSVLRSGTLWFAVGFHIAFDYMQLFIIGTPNGSQIPVGRMLDVTFHGPAWLTGGVLGTEASFLMYPEIALLWIFVHYRYRGRLQP